jgi:predicted enzyme related to lactoylglutathione lyase
MGERDRYEPGTFCWVDLATTDQEGAKSFYSGLFGWEAEDMPAGEGITYSMQRLRGKYVAAIAPQPEQQREAGVPPAWNNYVWVESADAAAEKAGSLGADVHVPPFDVLDAGRMAVIQDPQGAFFMVWEPKQHRGAQLVNEPGALCWNELASNDMEASAEFYRGLFGWNVQPWEGSERPYMVIQVGEQGNGGIRPTQDGEPPNWSAYFATDDVDAAGAKVEELGGGKLMDPLDIGIAKVLPIRDPQGAILALYAGELQP